VSIFQYQDVLEIKTIEGAIDYLKASIDIDDDVKDALELSMIAHKGQLRKSGEPYVVHPILVASIVARITEDHSMVIAALLHDVVEDTAVSIEEIETEYGKDIAHLVEGMTKIVQIRDASLMQESKDEKHTLSALSFRKMLLASIEDIRVLVVKLCDRLHNMLTLGALHAEKQMRIAEETLVVYAPIAHRLGIASIKNLLEDLSFPYLFAQEYASITEYLESNHTDLDLSLNAFIQKVDQILQKNGFTSDQYEIHSRIKHLYSIYLKQQRKGVSIDEILDLLAVRILVPTPIECYKVLGLIHTTFRPFGSRFKDYIAIAKDNGYQTIHTTVFDDTSIFEVQIRTFEMHKTAEYGVAAHWKYKLGTSGINLDWLHNLQYQNESVEAFYELIKNDLYSEDISVYTPRGKLVTLPRGATALDFAYAIHSEIGNGAYEATINKEKKSLITELNNGDIVNIKAHNEVIARCSWMQSVKTSRAKNHMKTNCKERLRHIDCASSVNILTAIMDVKFQRVYEWMEQEHLTDSCQKMSIDLDNLRDVVTKYRTEIEKNGRFARFLARRKFKLRPYHFGAITIYFNKTVQDCLFDYCCHPKNGDEIVAFIDDKSKVHVHHKLCKQAYKRLEAHEPMVFVQWESQTLFHYDLIISMQNAKGELAKFLTFLVKLDMNVHSIELGKESSETSKYCELVFDTLEFDINKLRSKIESKYKIIQLIRSDDAYRSM